MNSSGWIRGMMSKSMETQDYFQHVVKTIRMQLKKWDERYEVNLLQELLEQNNYEVVVSIEDVRYRVHLSNVDVVSLQDKSPYSLDRYLWLSLINNGLVIRVPSGDYLQKCFYVK